MTHQQLIRLIAILTNSGAASLTIPTLGRTTTIGITYLDGEAPEIMVAYGNNGNAFSITVEHWESVKGRFRDLPADTQWDAEQYTDTNWPECIYRHPSPYVAAILYYVTQIENFFAPMYQNQAIAE